MNVLYTSQKLHELFCEDDDPHPLHANASGDGDVVPGRCCRLCGGDNNLRYFGDTYVWEGVEERYDQLLSECFGVRVTPSDCMICEWCVRALRTTDRFRALVHAAFDQPISDFCSSVATLKSCSCINDVEDSNDVQLSPNLETSDEDLKEIPPKKPFELAKKREDRRRLFGDDEKALKRINIPCNVCKQRYPMLVPSKGCDKAFTCSRCKKNSELRGSVCKKCNIMMPATMMQEHLDLHARADMRGKSREEDRRFHYQPKSTNLSVENIVTKARAPKYQCTQCPKKYALARHLAMHIRNAHGDSFDNCCSFCGQNMESKDKLQEHLVEHSSLHQCDECYLVFKNKRTLATHSTKHHACCNTG